MPRPAGLPADGWTRIALAIDAYLDFTATSGRGWTAPLRAPDSGFGPAFAADARPRDLVVDRVRDALGRTTAPAENQALAVSSGFSTAQR